jgi:hypothetical protein
MATTTEPNARLKSDLDAAVRIADPRPAASLSFEPQQPALNGASERGRRSLNFKRLIEIRSGRNAGPSENDQASREPV